MDVSNMDLKMKYGLSSIRIWSNVRILRTQWWNSRACESTEFLYKLSI